MGTIRTVTETLIRKIKADILPDAVLVLTNDIFEVQHTPSVILQGPRLTEVFAFIDFNGPPTNNHAERAIRPIVKNIHGFSQCTGTEQYGRLCQPSSNGQVAGHIGAICDECIIGWDAKKSSVRPI